MVATISKQMLHRAAKIAKDHNENVVIFLHEGQMMTILVSSYEASLKKNNFEKLATIDKNGNFID